MTSSNSAPLPSSFDGNTDFYNESRLGKIKRRILEEPLIPLGCALTVWAIIGATKSMRKGDHKKTNLYFRRRLYAQTFTIAAMVAGNAYWQKDRVKRKEYEKQVQEKEKADKREKWIKELEARDEEEKAFQAELAKKKQKAGQGIGKVTEAVKEKVQETKENITRGNK